MGNNYTEVHVIGTNPDGSAFDGYMLQVEHCPTKRGSRFEKWGTCEKCTFDFPLGELEEHEGKLYCTRNGCYKDFLALETHRGGK